MKPTELLISTAFISALGKLDESLPESVQTELNNIGENLSADPASIGKLPQIAKSHVVLNEIFHKEYGELDRLVQGHRRGGSGAEISSSAPTDFLEYIITSSNSVATAKKRENIAFLQRLQTSITGESASERSDELDEYGLPLALSTNQTYIEIKEILEEMLQTKAAVKNWLHSSGRGSAKTPVEYILEGNLGAARRIVGALEYGIPA
jgi:hypothetical protein